MASYRELLVSSRELGVSKAFLIFRVVTLSEVMSTGLKYSLLVSATSRVLGALKMSSRGELNRESGSGLSLAI